ncbi:MAG: hypothetical protein H6981_11685 [Gammaproteobacteria bacterium]|nr:hypothetical protein [Gammaproteobacteria bacterium]MCP5137449.1 hypothetical protein [Gammaproteobacteria bacterium]
MAKPSTFRIAAMTALLLLAGNAHSAYIDQGIYVQDTVGGMDWLKLTETTGVSYDNRNTISYLSQGWRHATKAEVGSLFADFIPNAAEWDINYNPNIANQAGAFVNLFGTTYNNTGGWFNYVWGFTSDVNSLNGEMWAPWVGWDNLGNSFGIVGFDTLDPDYASSYSEPSMGHWLVRASVAETSVPTPAALALILGGLALVRRRTAISPTDRPSPVRAPS